MPIDRAAPLTFLRTAFHEDDWVAVFIKSYQSGRIAQRVRPVKQIQSAKFQAWLRAENAAGAARCPAPCRVSFFNDDRKVLAAPDRDCMQLRARGALNLPAGKHCGLPAGYRILRAGWARRRKCALLTWLRSIRT